MDAGVDHAGTHGIDADALLRHFLRQSDSEAIDRALAGGIVDVASARPQPRSHAADIDDAAAAPAMRRAHVAHGGPCTQHAAEHVGGKGLLPARQRHVGKGAARGHHTCIVDQAINTPCGLQHAIEQVLYLHLVGHVGLHGQGVMPQSCETLHQLLGRNRMAAPTESHAPTLLGRQQHGRRTNAPAAARDEHHRRIGARYA